MLEKGTHNVMTRKVELLAKPQNQMSKTITTISESQKEKLDLAAAAVCVVEGLLFTLFESPSMREFLYLLNPAYKTPSDRKWIAGFSSSSFLLTQL